MDGRGGWGPRTPLGWAVTLGSAGTQGPHTRLGSLSAGGGGGAGADRGADGVVVAAGEGDAASAATAPVAADHQVVDPKPQRQEQRLGRRRQRPGRPHHVVDHPGQLPVAVATVATEPLGPGQTPFSILTRYVTVTIVIEAPDTTSYHNLTYEKKI